MEKSAAVVAAPPVCSTHEAVADSTAADSMDDGCSTLYPRV